MAPHFPNKVTRHWSWFMFLWWPSLSISTSLCSTFNLTSARYPRLLRSPSREELFLAFAFAPMQWVAMCKPWAPLIGATDASAEGYVGTYARVSCEIACEVGSLHERRGDYTHLDRYGDGLKPSTELGAACAPEEGSEAGDIGQWRPCVGHKTRLGIPHRLPFGLWDFRIRLRGVGESAQHINVLELRSACTHLFALARHLSVIRARST